MTRQQGNEPDMPQMNDYKKKFFPVYAIQLVIYCVLAFLYIHFVLITDMTTSLRIVGMSYVAMLILYISPLYAFEEDEKKC